MDSLPVVIVELFLAEQNNPDLNGRNYGDMQGPVLDGLRLVCEPRIDLEPEISEILAQDEQNFPYEYYSVKFRTFADIPYTGYRRFLRHLLLDSAQIGNDYATQSYIQSIYGTKVEEPDKFKHQNAYRLHKANFTNEVLKPLNDELEDYRFSLRTSSKSNLETDLTITENSIPLEDRGRGRQCFIKTEFALQKGRTSQDLDILLLEEPENHLSHTNMKRLIQRIEDSEAKQLFIATHSNLISARLDLRKAILLHSAQPSLSQLSDLPEETAKFFMKAPDNNILDFALSERAILVEGDAEYILMEEFYHSASGEVLKNSGVHVISVGGTSFKRYLDLAKLLGTKTAVVRDNDKDPQANCVENYEDYTADNISVFFDPDPENYTFEVCLYKANTQLCDDLFSEDRRTLSVQDYMLKNKTDAAFHILERKSGEVCVPDYVQRAIEWIRS